MQSGDQASQLLREAPRGSQPSQPVTGRHTVLGDTRDAFGFADSSIHATPLPAVSRTVPTYVLSQAGNPFSLPSGAVVAHLKSTCSLSAVQYCCYAFTHRAILLAHVHFFVNYALGVMADHSLFCFVFYVCECMHMFVWVYACMDRCVCMCMGVCMQKSEVIEVSVRHLFQLLCT